jgi:hypothetical protein
MKKIGFIFFLLFLVSAMRSQNLNAYTDQVTKYFYIFDDGKLVEAEYLPVTQPAVGGNCVAYVDNSSNFKIYYDGSTSIEADNPPDRFYATDNLIAYDFNRKLSVFERGKSTTLCYQHGIYAVGDSIVAFYDTIAMVLKVYRDGEVKEMEGNVDKYSPKSLKVGDNIVAYVNYNNRFKTYYNNRTYDLESTSPSQYKTGCNTVAYVDRSTQNFKVFYHGNLLQLETFPPTSFKVADDLVAYIDNVGNFKVFYMGELNTVLTYEPQFYDAIDHVVVFGDVQNFNGYFAGKTTKLESYKPDSWQMDYNSLAYVDRFNKIRFFNEGVIKEVSSSIVNSYQLTRNVLMYSTDLESMHFYCNGKNY